MSLRRSILVIALTAGGGCHQWFFDVPWTCSTTADCAVWCNGVPWCAPAQCQAGYCVMDGGVIEASPDAGAPVDAGRTSLDSGTSPDAGPKADAGDAMDAGSMLDGGPLDAGDPTADAGAATCPGGCAANVTCCNGTCADLTTDVNNCGGCGLTCLPGERCLTTCGASPACVSLPRADNASCTETAECTTGSVCVYDEAKKCGVCLAGCGTTPCDAGYVCTTTGMGCAQACNPVSSPACPPPTTCSVLWGTQGESCCAP